MTGIPPPSRFPEQPIPPWRRAVLKVGSSLLAADGGGLSPRFALDLAHFVSANITAGRQLVIVSSGAVAAGRALIPPLPESGGALAARQALAALGQAQLIALWQRFFDRPVAQVLLTHDDLRNRRRYLNARATLRELLHLGTLPVVNENDTVSVDELKLGDNDNLAAIVAALIDAQALFIATDIDGLYTTDPRHHSDAQPLHEVRTLTPENLAMAGDSSSTVGTGGMRTKLEAALKAGAAGIDTYLFNGRSSDVVRGLAQHRLRGTRIHPTCTPIAARKYWLRHAPVEPGAILIDAGAAAALAQQGASLLPGGVLSAEGDFRRGDMIQIATRSPDHPSHPLARGLVQYSAADVRRIAGCHSRDIQTLLGYTYGDTIVHRDDLVLL
ncbi:glutamate 5-kinase [Xylella fastidiosa subsp. fastidiosa]|uniref:Glutamate 5-kinase n=13 Tax=Xylella fastidiosa TaxID=2371 RepID=PROB_XYLFT|nr:glutamate 5-kinase [Xylella fastidiosa]B2I7L1.1 RecName: Full=Glutamate 5-kinase; AltName: Full=Gamma-glutamyl kinase; Short=GK [Xylella fastidiosa M23]Q87EL0.1 RecName: Full=Glutamate 5-kinase; AltName: Full=Gamma-glutamyl kinase; Short=GK [Xylella fastidiosa Temecula1]AAO28181.1 glutamate 5-kinase [Xylella fastidiosa Temecula1]ACB91739.1 glutamate 5-kinase [Xylella fastidiosa M23]KGM21581.1 glutamate 5-kinase [Xylella fastidiosa]MDC7963098.1 glutamate 5-kinase [Xylella fastidiosa]NMR006